MKKILLIAALASMSAPALASKARLNALGNAEHLIDPQTAFENPSHNVWMADYVTFELGTTTPAGTAPSTSANAEGGFVRSSGDAKYMAYLGRRADFTQIVRTTYGFLPQENPIEFQYAMKGDINWGVGFNYSSSDKKSASQKQQAMGVRFGASTDVWEASASVGLSSTATGNTANAGIGLAADPNADYKGTTGFEIGGAYKMENLYVYGTVAQDGFKYESTVNAAGWNGAEVASQRVEVGVIDHNKIEGGQWFYGVAYQLQKDESKGATLATMNQKADNQYLPFLVGVEYDMATWATLRASVRQNVLISSEKTETSAASNTDTVDNNTTVGAGVGFKMGQFVLDAALQAATTGNIALGDGTAGNDFLTNVALTYTF